MNAAQKPNPWRSAVPGIARHEGIWDGTYRYYDAAGQQTDQHSSRLICRFTNETRWPYHQTNHYRWADGRKERREFPAQIRDGRLVFDRNLIDGWAASVPLDPFGRTLMLYWTRPAERDVYLYEMIQLSDCGRHRARVWQWFRDGRLFQRTLIDEELVSRDWSEYPSRLDQAEAA
ncbi:MAG: hypothetical protein JJT85_03935 [Chromatiales bacterium]|nr:hypothetical protein [Chromatiales bacterium]